MPVITAWIETPLFHVRICAVVIQVSSKLSPTVAKLDDPNKRKVAAIKKN
jgi:hypothetical protein